MFPVLILLLTKTKKPSVGKLEIFIKNHSIAFSEKGYIIASIMFFSGE